MGHGSRRQGQTSPPFESIRSSASSYSFIYWDLGLPAHTPTTGLRAATDQRYRRLIWARVRAILRRRLECSEGDTSGSLIS